MNSPAEAAALEADEADRAEMLSDREMMETLRAAGSSVFRFKVPKGLGHEQQGERFGVIVQSDSMLPRSVILVAPTSRSATSSFLPARGRRRWRPTAVLVEPSVPWMPSGSGVGWGS